MNRCTADFHEVQGVLNKVQYVQRALGDPGKLLESYAAADDARATTARSNFATR